MWDLVTALPPPYINSESSLSLQLYARTEGHGTRGLQGHTHITCTHLAYVRTSTFRSSDSRAARTESAAALPHCRSSHGAGGRGSNTAPSREERAERQQVVQRVIHQGAHLGRVRRQRRLEALGRLLEREQLRRERGGGVGIHPELLLLRQVRQAQCLLHRGVVGARQHHVVLQQRPAGVAHRGPRRQQHAVGPAGVARGSLLRGGRRCRGRRAVSQRNAHHQARAARSHARRHRRRRRRRRRLPRRRRLWRLLLGGGFEGMTQRQEAEQHARAVLAHGVQRLLAQLLRVRARVWARARARVRVQRLLAQLCSRARHARRSSARGRGPQGGGQGRTRRGDTGSGATCATQDSAAPMAARAAYTSSCRRCAVRDSCSCASASSALATHAGPGDAGSGSAAAVAAAAVGAAGAAGAG
eukprot:scaffold12815_cov69-Phaeocystis_antarctica.AAC.12